MSLFERFDMDCLNIIVEPDGKRRKQIYESLDKFTDNKISLKCPLFKSKNPINMVILECTDCKDKNQCAMNDKTLRVDEDSGEHHYIFSCKKCKKELVYEPKKQTDINSFNCSRKNLLVVGNCLSPIVKSTSDNINDLKQNEFGLTDEELGSIKIHQIPNPDRFVNKYELERYIKNYFLNIIKSQKYNGEFDFELA